MPNPSVMPMQDEQTRMMEQALARLHLRERSENACSVSAPRNSEKMTSEFDCPPTERSSKDESRSGSGPLFTHQLPPMPLHPPSLLPSTRMNPSSTSPSTSASPLSLRFRAKRMAFTTARPSRGPRLQRQQAVLSITDLLDPLSAPPAPRQNLSHQSLNVPKFRSLQNPFTRHRPRHDRHATRSANDSIDLVDASDDDFATVHNVASVIRRMRRPY